MTIRRSVCSVVFLCSLLLGGSRSFAQSIFATLTGLVSDPAGAVVPNAKVTLKDAMSGSTRTTVSNGGGYFTFASVPVSSYNLTVDAASFKKYEAKDISLGGGEQRSVNVVLAIGVAGETVQVDAENMAVAVTDSGEKSFALETQELENFTQVGSNAAEYIKIVPGFGISNGTQNKSNYNGQTIGINANGDSGSQSPLNAAYSYNGLPANSLDITADGAHVSDPGCNCDTPVNPNSDFVQEFKVLTSNFNAEEQKGPVVISSVTKAGGSQFHGNAFFTARNHSLNANDWLNNFDGVQQPANSYYYPGGSVGGPIIIPGTGFNKKRDKLFFFTGFEYYFQTLDTGLLRATVPTASELAGDFSPTSINGEGPVTASGQAPWQLTDAAVAAFGGTTIPACGGTPNGKCIDPNMLALAKLYPKPNTTPTATQEFNYVQAEVFSQNNKQWVVRGDWSLSDNTKVFVRYNLQREVQQFPVGLWWRNGDQVPYPTPIQGRNRSDSVSGTLTHVFSQSMTNETVVAYTFVGFPNVFENPSKVDRTTVGYGYKGVFQNGVAQIPSFGQFGPSEAGLVFNPGGFEAGGASSGLYANKYMPSVSDTLTKVIAKHTLKAGLFWEQIRNAQPGNGYTNGFDYVSHGDTPYSYGNEYADLLTGNLTDYQEQNKNRINDINYTTWEFFGQDSWKLARKLTVEIGMRFSHLTPWIDGLGFGYSIFDLTKYSASCAATFCGFQWHAADSSVPVGGFPTRALFYQPRLGAAYDVFGSGKSVVRGGWGRFYYHSGQFTSGLDASAGVKSADVKPNNWVGGAGCPTNSGGTAMFAAYLSCLNITASPSSPSAVDSKDDFQPYTDSWSVNIDQRTPWKGLLEAAYVGNRSRNLQNNSGGAGSNINMVPVGAMLTASNPGLADPNKFRPLNTVVGGNAVGYGDVNEATNNLYSNYNALQVSWAHRSTYYTIQANYSWQKALGIVSPTVDPFKLSANYGVLPTDRRQLFNAAYSIELGNRVHVNPFVNGALNGWQISGITQLQSGANITYGGNYGVNTNYNMNLNGAIIPGSKTGPTGPNPNGIPINNQSILGTNAQQLNPIVTCNPTSGLVAHQYVNGKCFSAPTTQGTNGPNLMPVAYGPRYFNSDLAVFKNFRMSETRSLQIRAQAFNFLNHPLYSFPGGPNLNLNFNQDATTGQITLGNPDTFGKTTEKQGARTMEFAAKFFF